MYFTYIIVSKFNSVKNYIGFTSNLAERLKAHNQGKSSHTRKYIPWEISFYTAFPDKIKAMNFEKYLKTGSGKAFSKRHF